MADQPERPRIGPAIIENIPAELKQRYQWIVWRYEWRVNKQDIGKWTKVPYTPGTTNKAMPNKEYTWRSFHAAWSCYLERPDFFDGIGFMFKKDDPYVGGDKDHCVKDGVIDPDVLDLIPHTYTEISPSGEGLKFIAKATGHYGRHTVKGELYNSGRFFTITGRVLEGHTCITECQEAVDAFLASLGAIERKNSAYNSNGSRAQLAAAIPQEDWAEGRRLLRDELSKLLSRLRASTAPTTQLGYVLKEDYRGLHMQYPGCGAVRGDGSIDSSQIRAIFANGTRGRGFTFPEFVALFYHFHGADCLAKWGTTQGFREEAATLWAKARPARPGETQRPAPAPQGTLLERCYQVLLNYRAGVSAIVMLDDVARDLNIHKGTASKVIKELVAANKITTRRYGSHGGLIVEFQPELTSKNGIEHSEAESGGSPSAKFEWDENRGELISEMATSDREAQNPRVPSAKIMDGNANCELISAEAESAAESENTLIALREEEPPYIDRVIYISPTVFLPGFGNSQKLAELAQNYLDQPAEAIGERLVNEQTGAITYRRTAKHFAGLVGGDEGRALAAYKAEQDRRQREESQAWQRFFAELKAMSNDELIAYIGGGCRRSVAELAREGSVFDSHLYQTRLKCAKQHLEWRGIQLPKRGVKQEPVTPRKKKQSARRVDQADLFGAEPHPRPNHDALGMIARLQARKQLNE